MTPRPRTPARGLPTDAPAAPDDRRRDYTRLRAPKNSSVACCQSPPRPDPHRHPSARAATDSAPSTANDPAQSWYCPRAPSHPPLLTGTHCYVPSECVPKLLSRYVLFITSNPLARKLWRHRRRWVCRGRDVARGGCRSRSVHPVPPREAGRA
eukprot:gene12909-biopygen21524